MIQLFDQGLEAFLRAEVPLPATTVDVSFAAPDRAWGASVTRPTVNLFLWDIQRNAMLANAGFDRVEQDGRTFRRQARPVVDFRYLVTTWAGEHRDEHQLLGAVLRALLLHPVLDPQHLPPALSLGAPIGVRLSAGDDRRPGDFWSAIDGQLKPGLQVTVTAELDVDRLAEAGPPTVGIDLHTTDRTTGRPRSGRRVTAQRDEDGPRLRRSGLVEEGRPIVTTADEA